MKRARWTRPRRNPPVPRELTQADIYKTEAAMSLTLRVLNEVIPQLKQMGIEPDLFNSLLPAAGLGLICGETGSGSQP